MSPHGSQAHVHDGTSFVDTWAQKGRPTGQLLAPASSWHAVVTIPEGTHEPPTPQVPDPTSSQALRAFVATEGAMMSQWPPVRTVEAFAPEKLLISLHLPGVIPKSTEPPCPQAVM